jgi:hypothetical protein
MGRLLLKSSHHIFFFNATASTLAWPFAQLYLPKQQLTL